MHTNPIMPTYFNQLPVSFERGEGAWLWDLQGKRYLDALSGIAVCSLGHAHPEITRVISEQAAKLIHISNTFQAPHQAKLAEKLCQVSGMEQVYFCNSGAEANEAAIKMTRLYARKKEIATPTVITLKNSFHGRSMATLSATGSERIQQGFEPLVADFVHLEINNIEELHTYCEQNPNVVAIMVELIQGDGGIRAVSQDYANAIRTLCDQNDYLMIVDEVQTGIARTGQWFCYQHYGLLPDVVTSAKALGNGVPIGACMARGKACDLFGPGKHGCTFGGNPLACAVGYAVLSIIEKENLVLNASQMGDYLLQKLKTTFANNPHVIEIRGRGLMIGIELDIKALSILAIGLKHGLLFNVVADKTIRLLAPLIINNTEADEIVKRLELSINEFFTTAEAPSL